MALDPSESEYLWVSHLCQGPGIALQSDACDVTLPLSIDPLCDLTEHMKVTMGHKFYPALLVLGSGAMALHYQTVLNKFLFCPVLLAFGNAGTGKT